MNYVNHYLKVYKIITAFLNLLVHQFFLSNSFYILFFTYIKISKNPSAKFFQDNKERLLKRFPKDIKVFLKKRKKKATI